MVNLGLLIILSSCLLASTVSGNPRKLTNPKLGQNQEEIQSAISQVFEDSYQSTFKYSSKYRPPSANLEEPEATLVEISLDSLKVTEFNEVNGTITFEVNFFREYKDSRLIFDLPRQVKFVSLDSVDIWKPEVKFLNADISENYGQYAVAPTSNDYLVTADGLVLIKSSLLIKMKTLQKLNEEKDFTSNIISHINGIEMVKLAWKERTPVTLLENTVTGISNTYQVQPTVGSCQHKESYGSLGVREFSCIELGFKFVKAYEP